jgi:hypothetical protein
MDFDSAIHLHTAEMDRLIASRREMILDPRHLNITSREIRSVTDEINDQVATIFQLKNARHEAETLETAAKLRESTIEPTDP